MSWQVRVTLKGIDCYSVTANSRPEADALKAQLESSEDVSSAEVVRA
ncbi:hypothetical protein G9464_20745 [Halostella sp. JP-L12]|nr:MULTISPECIES: hypothetical protein [Halostella]NHN50000.1 hypothetical protein [Halostella sp. JP-L12]